MTDLVVDLQYSEDGVTVPTSFAENDFICVFADGTQVNNFTISNDGKGGRVLVLADPAQQVCLAYKPGLDLNLQKFSPSIIDVLNKYFARVEQRFELVELRLSRALGAEICGLTGEEVIAELRACIEELKSPPAPPQPKLGPPFLPSKLDCFLEPIDLDTPLVWCELDADIDHFELPLPVIANIHVKPAPSQIIDAEFGEWGEVFVANFADSPKPLPAILEISA